MSSLAPVETEYGPKTPFCEELHALKYRSDGETFREAMNRVAAALSDNDAHFHAFKDALLNMRFLPGGRIQTAIGSTKNVTPYSCYVLPVDDSFVDGENSIMNAAKNAAATMRMGGGVGYDFSKLRPRGAMIKKLQSQSSGPVSFMEIFDAVCRCTASSGHRRGAQMGIMRCLAGESQIRTLCDGKVPIKNLVGKTPYLYAVRDGKLVVEKAASVFKSGTRHIISILLDNDSVIRCTPDHEFMLTDGSFVQAGSLVTGSSLMAMRKELDPKGYYRSGCTGMRSRLEHRIVYESLNGNIPTNHHIHHLNDVKTDNHPENLECLSKSAHAKIHGGALFDAHRNRIASERKGKTLEQWLGAERGSVIRANMCIAKQKQADTIGTWNAGLSTAKYKNHYTKGFRNQHTSNHKVVKVVDNGAIEDVYDISMPETHNFFVDDVCVHNCDHPSISEFIHAKNNQTRLTGFNISVAVTDEFMNAVIADGTFDLRFDGVVYQTVNARDLWDDIMRSTWDWAEPGVIFIDRINVMNNLWYCETLEACNPCSEQPLPNFGACLLGSFNLVKYLIPRNSAALEAIFGDRYAFDWELLSRDITQVVRAMDNVVDKAIYPLMQQELEAKSKRRMGLGITGLANTLEALGLPYGNAEFVDKAEHILSIMTNEIYMASALLAAEKGSFPLYDSEKYLRGNFIQTLWPSTQELIKQYGIRNSHLTSIAPTGTISLCSDNVSSSIEPVFDYEFDRTVIEFSGPRTETIRDFGIEHFGVNGKRSKDVTAKEHINVLVTVQKYIDSAVSKTVNAGPDVSWDDFKHIYMDAWQRGAKGCSTFRVSGKRRGVLESKSEAVPSCEIINGVRSCE